MNTKDFDQLIESVKQAGRIRRGELKPSRRFEIDPIDVKAVREKLKKSPSEFALMIGVSLATLQNWESGRAKPEGPAQVLLKVIEQNPRSVIRALAS